MHMCEHCEELKISFDIRSPNEMKNAIRVIRDNLADGTLEEEKNSYDSFQRIPVDGPWPDYVEKDFKCRHCGNMFMIQAETYHGTGGFWRPK